MGVRSLKSGYKPQPYNFRTSGGSNVKRAQMAEEAAIHLAETQWKEDADIDPPHGPTIIQTQLAYNTEEISLEELRETVRKFKRRKAPGPDEVPMEAFEEMDDAALREVLKFLNTMWNEEHVPESLLEA